MKNTDRTALTRGKLIEAARTLFAQHGYAATSTEQILAQAGVKRGALYHHFKDKAELFEAVCIQVSEEAYPIVERSADQGATPLEALVNGSTAWVEFMLRPDNRQIVLVDAPTVLGWAKWDALDQRLSAASLREGVADAAARGALSLRCPVELTTLMINGALNAIALRAGAPGADIQTTDWQAAVRALFEALVAPQASAAPAKRAPAA